jgi:membrane protease YdiL (CAAX protease family)
MNEGSSDLPNAPDVAPSMGATVDAGPPPSRAPRSIGTLIAWIVILALVGLTVLGTTFMKPDPAAAESMASWQYRMQVRMEYGIRGLIPGGDSPMPEFEQFKSGPPAVRLRSAVVLGDREGPARAVEALDELQRLLAAEQRALDGRDAEAEAALRSLYTSTDEPPPPRHTALAVEKLDDAQRQLLREHLDWFGELALAPNDGPTQAARKTLLDPTTSAMVKVFAGVLLLGLLGMTGLVGLVLFIRGVTIGRIALQLRPSTSLRGVLAETFAVWLVLFMGLSLFAGALAPADHILLWGGLAMLLSLSALAWPVLRGRSWTEVREAIGLVAPRNPVVEIGCGIASWWIHLPVMAAGFALSMILGMIALMFSTPAGPLDAVGGPSHPMQEPLSKGDGVAWIIFLACVVAPVVEEIFFRGVLYGHLRSATARWQREASILGSGLVCGVLFAAVHPQGWIAIPILTSVSLALSHAREWRGSLLAPMAAHALHNGVALLVATQVM